MTSDFCAQLKSLDDDWGRVERAMLRAAHAACAEAPAPSPEEITVGAKESEERKS